MQRERFGTRDLHYSAWHRVGSLARYIGFDRASRLAMTDLDAVLFSEHDPRTMEPLALVETARDVGQIAKEVRPLAALARRANIPAFIVLYKIADNSNPGDPRFADICMFRIRRVFPRPEVSWRVLTPPQWAEALVEIRRWSANRAGLEAANDSRF